MDSNLAQTIQDDMKTSLKNRSDAHAALQLDVLRLLFAEIKNKKIDKGSDLTNQEVITLIQKAVKTREDAIAQYRAAQRNDLVEKEQQEIAILQTYLPASFSRDEIAAIVDTVLANMSAQGIDPKDKKSFGLVMKHVMDEAKKTPDKLIDGGLISSVVKEKV